MESNILQLQQAFQEKEDENVRLKHYIDTILLNIVENYPQLLEVKPLERKWIASRKNKATLRHRAKCPNHPTLKWINLLKSMLC